MLSTISLYNCNTITVCLKIIIMFVFIFHFLLESLPSLEYLSMYSSISKASGVFFAIERSVIVILCHGYLVTD